MYSLLENKSVIGVQTCTIPTLQQNFMDVQTNIFCERKSIPNEKVDPLIEVKVNPSINEQLFDTKYKVAQIIIKDRDNDDPHHLHDLAKQFKTTEEIETFNRLKNEEQLPGRSIYNLIKETHAIKQKKMQN